MTGEPTVHTITIHVRRSCYWRSVGPTCQATQLHSHRSPGQTLVSGRVMISSRCVTDRASRSSLVTMNRFVLTAEIERRVQLMPLVDRADLVSDMVTYE